jgi:hypothetical protein
MDIVTVRPDANALKKRVHFFELAHEIEPQRFDDSIDHVDDYQRLVWYSKKDFSRFEKLNRALVDHYKSTLSTCCSTASSTQHKSGNDSSSTSEETTDDSYDEEEFNELNESMSLYGVDSVQAVVPICLRGLENISSLRAKVSLLHRFRDYHTVIIEEQKRQQLLGISDPILIGDVAMAVSKTSKAIALQVATEDAEFAKDYCKDVSQPIPVNALERILNQKVFSNTTQGDDASKNKIASLRPVPTHDSVQSFNVRKKIKDHGKKSSSFFGFAPVSKNAVQIEFQLEDDEENANPSVRSTRSTFSVKLEKIRNRMTKGNAKKHRMVNDNDSESRCSAATAPNMFSSTRSRKSTHSGAKSVYTPPVSSTSFISIKHQTSRTILEDVTESTTLLDGENDWDVQNIGHLGNSSVGRLNSSPNRRDITNRSRWQPPSTLTQQSSSSVSLSSAGQRSNKKFNTKSSLYVYTPETSMSSFNLSMTSLTSCRSSSMSVGSKDGGGILKYSSSYKTCNRDQRYDLSPEAVTDEQTLLIAVGDRIQI